MCDATVQEVKPLPLVRIHEANSNTLCLAGPSVLSFSRKMNGKPLFSVKVSSVVTE